MDRKKVTYLLTYFASGARSFRKSAIMMDSAPNKQVFLQGWFKIVNKPQAMMSGKTNRLVNEEVGESYGDKAAKGAT